MGMVSFHLLAGQTGAYAMTATGTYKRGVTFASATSQTLTTTYCLPPNGDMDGSGATDGADVQGFVSALLAGSSNVSELCPGDFNLDGSIDAADVSGFLDALLGP